MAYPMLLCVCRNPMSSPKILSVVEKVGAKVSEKGRTSADENANPANSAVQNSEKGTSFLVEISAAAQNTPSRGRPSRL